MGTPRSARDAADCRSLIRTTYRLRAIFAAWSIQNFQPNYKKRPAPMLTMRGRERNLTMNNSNEKPDREHEITNDPFDPASLRINPNISAGAIGVKRKIVTVKVGKPDKMEFCRVHPSEAYRIDTAIVEDKVNRESYLVAPALWPELPDFITLVRLCVAVNRHGTIFFWPAKLPDPNGRPMDWHTSMLEAQELATKSWVRVQADMSAGSYAVFEATGNLPKPEWPELSMGDLL